MCRIPDEILTEEQKESLKAWFEAERELELDSDHKSGAYSVESTE